jgi:hypothetical protein
MNYLENSGRNDFTICDDKTGKMVDVSQRYGAVETLKFLQEMYAAVQASAPSVQTFEIHFAIRSTCQHLGWSPGDIAVIEQYAAVGEALTSGAATSR